MPEGVEHTGRAIAEALEGRSEDRLDAGRR